MSGNRLLIFRLSSLGDVILATGALAVSGLRDREVDWVVKSQFAEPLIGHPRLRRVWKLERETGLRDWIRFCRALEQERYDEVWDLHSSLRTQIAKWVFRFGAMIRFVRNPKAGVQSTRWRTLRKPRCSLLGFYVFKRLWPKCWRPMPVAQRVSLFAGGSGGERPDLRHLLSERPVGGAPAAGTRFLCVMPDSRWEGKTWSVAKYVELLRGLLAEMMIDSVVVLGTPRDRKSVSLAEAMQRERLPVFSGIGRWSLPESARVLAGAKAYLGSDTGLAHLAEAVGTPAWVVFGPTVPEMGFGPWRPESRAIQSRIWCAPCGKDGRFCHRPVHRFACMTRLEVSEVRAELLAQLGKSERIESVRPDGWREPRSIALPMRLRIYRALCRVMAESIFKRARPEAETYPVYRERVLGREGEGIPSHARRTWFHAASVGELESLWLVILGWLENPDAEAVVTVFSRSAAGAVARLAEECKARPGRLRFAGYSPWEGHWWEELARWQPRAFVTVKYEAWPELWAGLAALRIPLWILGAQNRPALRVGWWAARLLTGRAPNLRFLVAQESDGPALRAEFSRAGVSVGGEPRWDRVFQRAAKGNPRARTLIERFANQPKPWAVFGSAWPEDLKAWGESLAQVSGTLWVVPHDLGAETLDAIEAELRSRRLAPIRSSRAGEGQRLLDSRAGDGRRLPDHRGGEGVAGVPCIVVDEMGFLLELYSAADWAFIGGGFGQGVHSTLEPAIQGIPLLAGTARAERFPEIRELRASGQLSLVADQAEIRQWLERDQKLSEIERQERRQRWKAEAESRRGAAKRVVELLSEPRR